MRKRTANHSKLVLPGILLVLAAAFVFADPTAACAQERKQAVSTQIKFVCGDGPVAAYDEFATVKVSIGNRVLSSALTYDVPVGAQDLKVTTQPPTGSWTIREIRFFDRSNVDGPEQSFSPKLGTTATFPLKLSSRYGTNVSQLEITIDQCGTAGPEHKIVKVRSPEKNYAWCADTYSFVSVERTPKSVPSDRVGGIQEEDGSFSNFFPLLMELELPGRTKVIVPDHDTVGDGWQVRVKVPGVAILNLEDETVMTLPCREANQKEWITAEIEASGGVLNFISNRLAGQPHPDFFIVTTKEAIGGSKDRKGENYHHGSVSSFAGPKFTLDMRTPGWSKFAVQEGELEITPRNSKLRPFILRAGQRAEVSLNSVVGPESSNAKPPATSTARELSGLWRNPGGSATYRLRQIGNKLHWIVDAVSAGSFANIFEGDIRGESIEGSWIDLPGSPLIGGGKLSLKIASECMLVKTNEVNHYGADVWVKKGSRCDVVGLK